MKFRLKGWYFVVLFFIALIVWIRWDDAKSKKRQQEYNAILAELSRPMPIDSASLLWENAYKKAGSYNERRLCLGKTILCYEGQNTQDKALELLKQYEDEFEVSTSTLIHNAMIQNQIGNERKCKQILDSIIGSPLLYKEPSLSDICKNFFDKTDTQNTACLNFFYEYICRIVAIQYRISMESEMPQKIELYEKFDDYESIDDVIMEYQVFLDTNPHFQSLFLGERLCILQQTHLYLFQNYWNPEYAIDDLLRFKWNFYSMYLDEYDKCYGYKKTKKHFQVLMTKHKLASEGYQKFLLNAYMTLNDVNNKYNLTYDEYKNLRREGLGYVVKLTPKIFLNQQSAFINAGVTKPCLLLSCNGWSICDSTLFSRDMVVADSGKIKHIVILKDDYTLDTLRIKEDKLGVEISYRPVCSMTLDLIRKIVLNKRSNVFIAKCPNEFN